MFDTYKVESQMWHHFPKALIMHHTYSTNGHDRRREMKRYIPERTCHIVEYEDTGIPTCSECGAIQSEDSTVYYCWCCGAKVSE